MPIGRIKRKYGSLMVAMVAFVVAVGLSSSARADGPISEDEAYQIGLEAYIYAYPLVTMDLTRRQMTNVEKAGQAPRRTPMNSLYHMRAYPPGDFREVVRPNFDTLYSMAWFDLTKEPMILTIPAAGDRYYLLPLYDMWTNVFATPGSRTSGQKGGNFAIVAPGWKGVLPSGVQKIRAPTPYVWMIGRVQANGPQDYENVHHFQDGLAVVPLSRWNKAPLPVLGTIDPAVDMTTAPLAQVNSLPAAAYFHYAAELMKLQPPQGTDFSIRQRLRRIGFVPGKGFDIDKVDPAVQRGLQRAAQDGPGMIKAKVARAAPRVNGWMTMIDCVGVYGNNYLMRAAVTLAGLGANPAEDAIYPLAFVDQDNKPFDGANRYVLHFNKDQLPPAAAFWSLTLYDAQGFTAPNAQQRYAIGDRDALKFDADGGLSLYVQAEFPGAEQESNWLPAPKGNFNLMLRLYNVKAAALNGSWSPPAVMRQD